MVGSVLVGGIFFYFRGSIDHFFAVDRCVKSGGTFDYASNECRTATSTPEADTVGDAELPALLAKARITVPDTPGVVVTLEDGAGEYASGLEEGVVTIGDVRALLATANGQYAIAPFAVSRGGSGTFVYVGLFSFSDNALSSIDYALLGDRVKVEGIEVKGEGQFSVSYLDRKENEPMAAPPTIEKVADFSAIDGKLLQFGPTDDRISIDAPKPGDTIVSPLTVTGKARGSWYFEASFPVIVTDWDGKIIAEVPAQAEGEWMTEEFVPFKAVIAFPPQEKGSRGTVIFKRDNASGLPQHDAAVEIPVVF